MYVYDLYSDPIQRTVLQKHVHLSTELKSKMDKKRTISQVPYGILCLQLQQLHSQQPPRACLRNTSNSRAVGGCGIPTAFFTARRGELADVFGDGVYPRIPEPSHSL